MTDAAIGLRERGIGVVVLDIEGTTTPISFVHGVLFPYARARLRAYLRDCPSDAAIAMLRDEQRSEQRSDRSAPAEIAAYCEWLMDQDRKSPGLKTLQGRIWARGYESGALHGDVFPDVVPALRRWRAAGIGTAIYSSGSVLAQRNLFGTTAEGDITPLLDQFFDTGIGAKVDAASYRRIAGELRRDANEILFVSDVATELDAARDAGMCVLLCIRPGNPPETASGDVPSVRSFDEITV